MEVYINTDTACDNTAANYIIYANPAESGTADICTHVSAFKRNADVQARCTASTSRSACEAE